MHNQVLKSIYGNNAVLQQLVYNGMSDDQLMGHDGTHAIACTIHDVYKHTRVAE